MQLRHSLEAFREHFANYLRIAYIGQQKLLYSSWKNEYQLEAGNITLCVLLIIPQMVMKS